MLLDASPEQLIEEIGATGMELQNPQLSEPHCYRGHHIYEIQRVCLSYGYGLIPFGHTGTLVYGNDDSVEHEFICMPMPEVLKLCEKAKGIIILPGHAVAFENDTIYDPKGRTYPLDKEILLTSEVWRMVRL